MLIFNMGTHIMVDGYYIEKNNLKVEITNYGDQFFDVCYVTKTDDDYDLCGNEMYTNIIGFEDASQTAKYLASQAGLTEKDILIFNASHYYDIEKEAIIPYEKYKENYL